MHVVKGKTIRPIVLYTKKHLRAASTVRDSLAEVNDQGEFVRVASGYREFISNDHPIYKPEKNRYHLYVSYACPWANRCLVMSKWKGLDSHKIISLTVVHPTWQKTKPEDPNDKHFGWAFYDSSSQKGLLSLSGYGSFHVEGCTPDPNNANVKFIRDLYEMGKDNTVKKYSVPVLWDKKTSTIVNNESSDILRIFNAAFDAFLPKKTEDDPLFPFLHHDFAPSHLLLEINALNDFIYQNINDGVYKCGFSKSQTAYQDAMKNLFNALFKIEDTLSKNRYLLGNHLTETDIRLFMTLIRFDEVYVVYFKCNKKMLMHNYPHIHNYMRELYQMPLMKECIHMDHIKTHYYTSHPKLNPYSIIPEGPSVIPDLLQKHNRHKLSEDSFLCNG